MPIAVTRRLLASAGATAATNTVTAKKQSLTAAAVTAKKADSGFGVEVLGSRGPGRSHKCKREPEQQTWVRDRLRQARRR